MAKRTEPQVKQLAERLTAGSGKKTEEIGVSGLRRSGGIILEEWDTDLRGSRGAKIYEEMRRADPIVATALRAIKWVLGRVDWRVDPGGTTPGDEEAAAFLESNMADMSITWQRFIRDGLTCLDFGWAYLEFIFKQRRGNNADPPSKFDDGRLGWRKLALRAQTSLQEWRFDESGGILGMVQSISGKPVFIPIEKSVLFRTDAERNNPEGISLLRPTYRPWLIKKQLEEVEAIGAERDLTGVLVITLPVGATNADRDKARQLLEEYKADDMAGFIAPRLGEKDSEKFDFTIISSPGSKPINLNDVIQRYQMEMMRAFLAQFLMLGQGGAGSWALARDQRGMFEVALGDIVVNLEETINGYLVPPLFRYNDFGTLTALPQIHAGRIGKADMDKFATAVSKLVQVGMLTYDRGLEDFVREELELPGLPEETGAKPPQDTGQQQAVEVEEDEEDIWDALPHEENEIAWGQRETESQKRLQDTEDESKGFSDLLTFARGVNYEKLIERHQDKFRREMQSYGARLRAGEINYHTWRLGSFATVQRTVEDGYRLGLAKSRNIAPSRIKLVPMDRKAIARSVDNQLKYFRGFAKKTRISIREGQELTTMVDTRGGLYAGALRDAGSEAQCLAEPEKKLRWVRHKTDSCDTCLEHAGQVKTGKEWREAGVWPSHGVTCNGQCGCTLGAVAVSEEVPVEGGLPRNQRTVKQSLKDTAEYRKPDDVKKIHLLATDDFKKLPGMEEWDVAAYQTKTKVIYVNEGRFSLMGADGKQVLDHEIGHAVGERLIQKHEYEVVQFWDKHKDALSGPQKYDPSEGFAELFAIYTADKPRFLRIAGPKGADIFNAILRS